MSRLSLCPPVVDDRGTTSLQRMRKLPLKNTGELHSALVSAAGYARKLGQSMYVYSGNSYGHAVWRVSFKASEYLNPINNTGRKVAQVTPELVLAWHEVCRGETHDPT